MSKKLPRVTASELIKVLKKTGFEEARSSGSHIIYKRKIDSTRFVIPYHSGRIIHPKIVKDLLKICNLSVDEFKNLL